MFYLKLLFFAAVLLLFMNACTALAPVPASQGVATATASTSPASDQAVITPLATPGGAASPSGAAFETLTSAAAPSLTPEQTPTGATVDAATGTPSPTQSPQQACDDMMARGQPGLYVVSIQPYPDLVWDREPRSFRVDLCDSTSVPTPLGSRFLVFVYFPGETRPRGQTSELPIRLPPGLTEITLGTWIPGLQNHISACVVQPPVEFSVAYRYPPDMSVFHPVPHADGHDRKIFSVKCVGIFP